MAINGSGKGEVRMNNPKLEALEDLQISRAS